MKAPQYFETLSRVFFPSATKICVELARREDRRQAAAAASCAVSQVRAQRRAESLTNEVALRRINSLFGRTTGVTTLIRMLTGVSRRNFRESILNLNGSDERVEQNNDTSLRSCEDFFPGSFLVDQSQAWLVSRRKKLPELDVNLVQLGLGLVVRQPLR